MYHVCIVEDQSEEAKRLADCLALFAKKKQAEFSVRAFSNAEDALSQYVPGVFDVIFLDIVLPGKSGMEAARELRRMDEKSILIFVTGEKGLALQGYSVDALDYIIKPVEPISFFATMERVLRELGRRAGVQIRVNTNDGLVFLTTDEIVYVDVYGHTLSYHTGTATVLEWSTLQQAEAVLSPHGFVRCSSSHLVNLRFVKGIEKGELLVGDERIRITRSYKNEVIRRLNQFYML